MAKSKILMSILSITLTLTLLFSSLAAAAAAAEQSPFYRDISPTSMGLRKEKLTHLHFYFHDIPTGPKPTTVKIAEAQMTNTSSSQFGLLVIADDLLTVGPELNSTLVGKAQGIFGFSDQNETALTMILNFAFTEGKYNGSTLSMLGRNPIFTVREMPIVGGSGAFRFARGYAQAKGHSFVVDTGSAVVEYDIYVFHY